MPRSDTGDFSLVEKFDLSPPALRSLAEKLSQPAAIAVLAQAIAAGGYLDDAIAAQIVAGGNAGQPAMQLAPVRSFATDFRNATRDALVFDLANATYEVDAGDGNRTAIRPTTLNVPMTVMLKAGQVGRNWDVRIRYRSVSATPHTSSVPTLYARYLGVDDFVSGHKSFNAAVTGQVVARHRWGATNADANLNSADTDVTSTAERLLRVRVLEDCIQVKSWLEASGEPDWQITYRPNLTADVLEYGSAGVSLLWVNTQVYLSEVSITEVARLDDNLLWNADLAMTDSQALVAPLNQPAFWAGRTTPTLGTLSMPDTVDRRGATRKCLQVAKASQNADASLWCQLLYAQQRNGPTLAKKRGRPTVPDFPKAVDVSFWSKATAVQHTGAGTLGAVFVMYYSDYAGAGLNTGQPDYFGNIGPGGLGVGTWDWHYETHRIHLEQWHKVWRIEPSFGFHDADVTGTLQFLDIALKAVA